MVDPGKKFCPYCGKELKATASYCLHCGSLLGGVKPSEARKNPPPPRPEPVVVGVAGGVLARGDQVGGWMVLRLVDQGPYGERYLAMDRKSHKPMALRLLPPARMQDVDASARFPQEALRLTQLQHPLLVSACASVVEQGRYHVISPWVEGQTLASILLRSRSKGELIPLKTALLVMGDVLAALRAGHAHPDSLAHGDLSPASILFSKQGKTLLQDYGLHALLRPLPRERLHEDTLLEYRAPEVLRGGAVTPRADVYGVGAILYEMLTGKPPFPRLTATGVECMEGHLGKRPVPVEELRPDVPDWLAQRIHTALEKDPSLRYRDAEEMLEGRGPAGRATPSSPSVPQVPDTVMEMFRARAQVADEPAFPEVLSDSNEWEVEVSWAESRQKKKLYLVGAMALLGVGLIAFLGISSLMRDVGPRDEEGAGGGAGALLEDKGTRPEDQPEDPTKPRPAETAGGVLPSPADEILNKEMPTLGPAGTPMDDERYRSMADNAARRIAKDLEEPAGKGRKTGSGSGRPGFELSWTGTGQASGKDGTGGTPQGNSGASGTSASSQAGAGSAGTGASGNNGGTAGRNVSTGSGGTQGASGASGDQGTGVPEKVTVLSQAQSQLSTARSQAGKASGYLEEAALWLEVSRGKRQVAGVSIPEAARKCRQAADRTRSEVQKAQSSARKAIELARRAQKEEGVSAGQVQKMEQDAQGILSNIEPLPGFANDWAIKAENKGKEWETLH